jgi:hypothetical protein
MAFVSVKLNNPLVLAAFVLRIFQVIGGSKLVVDSIRYTYPGVPLKLNCTVRLDETTTALTIVTGIVLEGSVTVSTPGL